MGDNSAQAIDLHYTAIPPDDVAKVVNPTNNLTKYIKDLYELRDIVTDWWSLQ